MDLCKRAKESYVLGNAYRTGIGVTSDVDVALDHYRTAAMLGHPEAMFELYRLTCEEAQGADLLDHLDLKRVEDPNGRSWLFRAADAGSPRAMFHLALHFHPRWYERRNEEQSKAWLVRALEHRDAATCHEIGLAYENGEWGDESTEYTTWLRVEMDRTGASDRWEFEDFRIKEEVTGEADETDRPQRRDWAVEMRFAAYWYRKGALKGDLDCMIRFSDCLMNGRGLPQDIELGTHWLKTVASLGYPPAMSRLAEYHLKGVGVALSGKLARFWYARAAKAGDKWSSERLHQLEDRPSDRERDELPF